jgi:hypothetical protein
MLLVTQVLAQLLVHSVALVRHHWNILTAVLVLLVLCLMSRVLVRCLMGGFLHQIRGCQVVQSQGKAFLLF